MQLGQEATEQWLANLSTHPIFTTPPSNPSKDMNDLSSRKRMNKMCFRGPDLILAVGNELRIATFIDSKIANGRSMGSFKTLHTPNVQFEIHHVVLCTGGKLLAVAGTHQVAVIVLPRPSYHKLVNTRVDCKSTQIGQYYHAVSGSSRIAKVDWHPWHDGGSSLLVLTSDGNLREYDVSRDAEEPQQTLSFVPPHNRGSGGRGQYTVEDPSAREAVSFNVGKGKADWSPLTIYALMKNGDIWAMAPFLPSNALVPSTYVPALECFVAAKRELIEAGTSAFMTSHHHPSEAEFEEDDMMALINDHQLKYVNALVKQLSAPSKGRFGISPSTLELEAEGSSFMGDSSTRSRVNIHPPSANVNKRPVARQGPFLLQPAPPELDADDDDNEASDMVYIGLGHDEELEGPSVSSKGSDQLGVGVVLIVYRDGKVDVCLDLDKVEAKWDLSTGLKAKKAQSATDFPSLTVYETIDLGIIANLREVVSDSSSSSSINSLLHGNYPMFHVDPLYSGRVFVSHAFGVHVIDMRKWMRNISRALLNEDDDTLLAQALKGAEQSDVSYLLSSFSVELKSSTPITALSIVDNGFFNYTLFAVTSHYQMVPVELNLRPVDLDVQEEENPPARSRSPTSPLPGRSRGGPPLSLAAGSSNISSTTPETPNAYISLLAKEPFTIPSLKTRPSNVAIPPKSGAPGFAITPDVLRALGKRVESFRSDMRDMSDFVNVMQERIALQNRELQRQLAKLAEMTSLIESFGAKESAVGRQGTAGTAGTTGRVTEVLERQKSLLARSDHVLQRLMDSYSPKLSEFEVKWFAELGRMQREVNGESEDDDGRSLKSRTELLTHQLNVLRPQMEEIARKEDERKKLSAKFKYNNGAPTGLGSAQLRSIQRRLAQETKILEDARSQAQRLTKWLQTQDEF